MPHPVMLFNPDSRSANLLIPGLVAILLTFSGTLLAAFSIVRERERGTLEQLMVTPVSPIAVVVGKLVPYLVLAFLQLLLVLGLMTWVFRVPIHGSLPLLLGLSVVYLAALLSLGLLISSRASSQMEAVQGAQMVLLPSIMLSGYIFPLSSLPDFLLPISQILPATHFIAISRGIILRGATFMDLWEHVAALVAIALVLVAASSQGRGAQPGSRTRQRSASSGQAARISAKVRPSKTPKQRSRRAGVATSGAPVASATAWAVCSARDRSLL